MRRRKRCGHTLQVPAAVFIPFWLLAWVVWLGRLGSGTQALPVDLTKDVFVEHWPLIGHVLADPHYRAEYVKRLKLGLAMHNPARLGKQIEQLWASLAPFLDPSAPGGEDSEATKIDWDKAEDSVSELVINIKDRKTNVGNELARLERALEEAAARAKRKKSGPTLADVKTGKPRKKGTKKRRQTRAADASRRDEL